MKNALIITGKMVQDHEFIYPYYRLKEAGFGIAVALKDGGITTGILGTKIPSDQFCEVINHDNIFSNLDGIDLLVIPGGAKCMEYLRQQTIIVSFIEEINKHGKIIASICHGTQMLISAKVVKGRKISGYYSIKDDIINAGAEYVDASAVVDKNIVTCPHYKYLGDWMKKALEMVDENTFN